MIWISIIPFVIFAKNMISTYIQGRKTLIGLPKKLKNIFSKNETAETVANDKSDEVNNKE